MKNKQNKKAKPSPLKLANCLILSVRNCKNGKIIITLVPYFKK